MFLAALAEEILPASYAREEREFTEAAAVPPIGGTKYPKWRGAGG